MQQEHGAGTKSQALCQSAGELKQEAGRQSQGNECRDCSGEWGWAAFHRRHDEGLEVSEGLELSAIFSYFFF